MVNTIDDIFNKDELYHHCVYCGDIYQNGWEGEVIYNNGKGVRLNKEFVPYQITSGACKPCYKIELKKYKQ